MFVLRTGLQGNGKTLNTIKEVDTKAAKEGRVVYYHNIRGFNPDHEAIQAEWLEFDNPLLWHELPQNAMVVIDEAQTFFRVRPPTSAVPAYASALETMRHRGHELHCITQNPGLIDVHFRKLCNSHIHYVRGHKGKVVKRWEFERVNMDVEKRNDFSDGEATRVLLDKTYFGVYESVAQGSEHHMKFKPPRALFVLLACVLFIGFFGYKFYKNRLAPQESTASDFSQVSDVQSSGLPLQSGAKKLVTTEEYIDLRVPRFSDVPSSAPIYDDLAAPVTYPKLYCLSTSDPDLVANRPAATVQDGVSCQCYTQQTTKYHTTLDFCISAARDGYFDHAKPDRQPQNNQYAATGQQQYQQNQPQDTEPDQTRLTVVPHTRNKHFMW